MLKRIDRMTLINFNEEYHTYSVNGVGKQSMTQFLKAAGIIGDYAGVSDYYRDRGTRAHGACVLHAQGWLDWGSVADDILVYVKTFKSIAERLGLSYVSAEEPSYSEALDICGMYDLIMSGGGKRFLMELKTGIFPMWGGLQLAGYETMVDVDDVMGISLMDAKVFVKDDDFLSNTLVLDNIKNGTFDLEKWKSNKKRRHMKVLKDST